jgi:hypothetical protein
MGQSVADVDRNNLSETSFMLEIFRGGPTDTYHHVLILIEREDQAVGRSALMP